MVWASGLLIGNVLASHAAVDHEAIVVTHGLHGVAYLIFASSTVIVRPSLVDVYGKRSVNLLHIGLTLVGLVNLYGAYAYAVESRGPTHWSSDVINYGIPVALLALGVSSISAARAITNDRRIASGNSSDSRQ